MGIKIRPMPQKGRLSQKIQRHALSAKAPPIIGPMTVPNDQVSERILIHFPRCRSGIRSAMRTSVRAMIPPPPTPWMQRPTSITGILLHIAATIEPTVKATIAPKRVHFLPKMSDIMLNVGWNTVEATRKEVPAQKASMAVPLRASAIVYTRVNAVI